MSAPFKMVRLQAGYPDNGAGIVRVPVGLDLQGARMIWQCAMLQEAPGGRPVPRRFRDWLVERCGGQIVHRRAA